MPDIPKHKISSERTIRQSDETTESLLEKNEHDSSRCDVCMQGSQQRRYRHCSWTKFAIGISISSSLCLLILYFTLANALIWAAKDCECVSTDRLTETRFFRDTRYMSIEPETDHLWEEWMSPLTGVTKTENGSIEAISMFVLVCNDSRAPRKLMIDFRFHQLHCLSGVRKALQDAANGKDIGRSSKDGLQHWPHCLDFLKSVGTPVPVGLPQLLIREQAILCNADSTIEHPLIEAETGIVIIDGADDVRMCRDNRPLYDKWKANSMFSQYQ